MKKPSFWAGTWGYGVVVACVIVADQVSKWHAVGALTRAFEAPGGDDALSFSDKLGRFLWTKHPGRGGAVAVLDDFWHFRYVENPGAAWGFLSGESAAAFRTPFFLCVSLAAMVFLFNYFRRSLPEQRVLRTGLALVFGGAIGNFLDRVRLGYVIDFIDWHWYDKATWPTFNVADSAISIGVSILLLEMFLQKPQESVPGAKPARGAG